MALIKTIVPPLMNLHTGILFRNSRKLTIKIKDDIVHENFLKYNKGVFQIAVTDIFKNVTYHFDNKKNYKKFLELYDMEMHDYNFHERVRTGYYKRILNQWKTEEINNTI